MKKFVWLIALQTMLVHESWSNSDNEDWSTCPHRCKCTWTGGKRTAECQDASMTALPKFTYPDKIQVLHLENNPLRTLSDKIFMNGGMINLQKVYLQNCSLEAMHQNAFQSLVLMIELDLSNNNIKTLVQGTFEGNIRIRKLWLQNNPLKSLLDFNFPSIPHLKSLDLSNTLLKRLGRATFLKVENLEVLSLKDNHFHRIDHNVFHHLEHLKSLKLENNPWHCDCRLENFWQWVMKKNLFNQPTSCVAPRKLSLVSWDKLELKDLACPPRVLVREPEKSVTLGSKVSLSCFISGNHRKVHWIRSGFIIKNNSLSQDGGHQFYMIRRSGDRKIWLNLTIENVDRTGSGAYSCVAENEGGMAEGNATIVITESITYIGKARNELNMVVVCIAAITCVSIILLLFMVFFALKSKQRNRSMSVIDNNSEVNAKSAETTTVVLEEKYDSNIKSKSNCDSTFIADIIEREQNCNSSNSNNSGYSGHTLDDSGVGSSSSNIVKLDHTNSDSNNGTNKTLSEGFQNKSGRRPHYPDLVTLPISENDMQLQHERLDSLTYQQALPHTSAIGFANTLFDLQQQEMSEPNTSIINDMWAPNISSSTNLLGRSADSDSDITNFYQFNGEDVNNFQNCDFTLPRKPLRTTHCKLNSKANISEFSLPRKKGLWRQIPSSFTEADFDYMKQEVTSRKLSSSQLEPESRANYHIGREKGFLTETDPRHVLLFKSTSNNSANSKNPTYLRGFHDCDKAELNFCEDEETMKGCFSEEIDMSLTKSEINSSNFQLAKQLDKRTQLLHALVQDQTDTIV